MTVQPLSPIRKAWYRWKALRLPWRKRFLIGLDLQNNTFWEFRDQINAGRMRRIVQTPIETQYSDVKISPQWHQWLRHTREDAPSLEELRGDVERLRDLKVLARQADERWAKKGSFLEGPTARERLLGEEGRVRARDGEGDPDLRREERGYETEERGNVTRTRTKESEHEYEKGEESPKKKKVEKKVQPMKEKEYKDDPWKQARGGPSEQWQPKAWDPSDIPTPTRR